MLKVAILKITSFIGAIGAEHYYGKLHFGIKEEELRRKLTKEDAVKLNKKDYSFGFGSYRAGQRSERFDTIEQVEAEAIEYFRKKLVPQGYDLLLSGKPFDAHSPQKVLDGTDSDLVGQLRAIYERRKGLTWDKNWKSVENLCNQWERLLQCQS